MFGILPDLLILDDSLGHCVLLDEMEPGFLLLGIGSSPWRPTLWSDALIINTILAVNIRTVTILVNFFFFSFNNKNFFLIQ